MNRALLCAVLVSASSCASAAIRLDDKEALAVGMKIWKNEANQSVDRLTHWNEGENFASLGIGHFIWYKAGEPGPFTESFPGLLEKIASDPNAPALPAWLKPGSHCPWTDKKDFEAKFRSPETNELRGILQKTIALQARYAADRVEAALPKILTAAPASERARLQARFDRVAAAGGNGVYALMDYVNFKGEGTNPSERYNGQGWGLLQVLELIDEAKPAVEGFADAADAALTRRVANSDPAKNEARWLPGWRKRLKTYLEP